MENRFYNEFDREEWGGARRGDYRTAFQVDRDRIIHSYAFRRLQSKTQVFFSGEYDFYRTRLTHSIEVAQIGRSICNYLRSLGEPMTPEFHIDPDLVEAVCLAHDLGHPPFGHSGERALQELMRDRGGFEGNAQTLSLLAETIYQTESTARGMQPTRALMDGVLKYKALYGEYREPPHHHFLYDPQAACRDFVLGGRLPSDLVDSAGDFPEGINRIKSVECQVMDWADDAAYSLNDVVDGVRAGFLTLERIESWASKQDIDAESQKHLDTLIDAIRADKLEPVFSMKIGAFIEACRLKARCHSLADLTNRYAFELEVAPAARKEAGLFKRLAADAIFQSPQLYQFEYKGRFMLRGLFEALWEFYGEPDPGTRRIGILPDHAARLVDAESTPAGRARRICDYLASLTDGMAIRIYRRLFDADYGSIRDLS